ncbi:DNA mismatch repair protein PMS1, putative [Plasmodium berghei]|uniref:DNA mismatch repair protein PMS1, putative n=2 Tax=Plasmodium berghei TaxID=5821 RepID=A0A509AES7_PLABA|nr:DNA mismatch repair protein PMS1, putative [Plasmodium berghei ANKA]CXH88903.1 DNA mismatch repair protein PMS1, putative [Plasmodium berghei]SCL90264.1 DNA mismatch repair protein PMS1, putative [Plasmodium berghei]SCM15255.1 DNA mismatch repair protein PMS1, putative [Plasmodium berghei]SCM17050.1 DNA mismatch repair protein PMS1, putative [Plasmodium berghei]SCN21931.1 DNA mismatch repair protein PMS1, putative [Plasmodium berghei]|eukprot:XP_034419830.1 DNA mismatch repair protein PMS1, putative [Plasmodium berghei ANKA]
MKIKSIGDESIHNICSSQVIFTLSNVVKELVENSIDAGATEIKVKLVENGIKLIEVNDNGNGIKKINFENVCARHATSKISEFDDIHNILNTLGFRGEALNSLCMLSDLYISTKHDEFEHGYLLKFDKFGKLLHEEPIARLRGTTVSCENIFKNIPIRKKDLIKNIKSQLSDLLSLMQQYAIIYHEIKFMIFNVVTQKGCTKNMNMLITNGSDDIKKNFYSIFGKKNIGNLIDLNIKNENWSVKGYISDSNSGRRDKDLQFYYMNSRPIHVIKNVNKIINTIYREFNSRLYPIIICNILSDSKNIDINVTPDKREVFFTFENELCEEIKTELIKLLTPKTSNFVDTQIDDYFFVKNNRIIKNEETKNEETKNEETKNEETKNEETKNEESTNIERPLFESDDLSYTSINYKKIVKNEYKEKKENYNIFRKEVNGNEDIENLYFNGEKQKKYNNKMDNQKDKNFEDTEKNYINNDIKIKKEFEKSYENEHNEYTSKIRKIVKDEEVEYYEYKYEENTNFNDKNILHNSRNMDSKWKEITPSFIDDKRLSDDSGVDKSKVDVKNDTFSKYGLNKIGSESDAIKTEVIKEKNESEDHIKEIENGEIVYEYKLDNGSEKVKKGIVKENEYWFEKLKENIKNNSIKNIPININTYINREDMKRGFDYDQINLINLTNSEKIRNTIFKKMKEIEKINDYLCLTDEKEENKYNDLFKNDLNIQQNCNNSSKSINGIENEEDINFDNIDEQKKDLYFKSNLFKKLKICGQFNKGFIISKIDLLYFKNGNSKSENVKMENNRNEAEENEYIERKNNYALFIIDQHAADEKSNFEKYNKIFTMKSQKLINKIELELSPAQIHIIEKNFVIFLRNGFEIEIIDEPINKKRKINNDENMDNNIINEEALMEMKVYLLSLPVFNGKILEVVDFMSLLYHLSNNPIIFDKQIDGSFLKNNKKLTDNTEMWFNYNFPRPQKVWKILASKACRNAVMVGKTLNISEMITIKKKLSVLKNPWNCPHGRPTIKYIINNIEIQKYYTHYYLKLYEEITNLRKTKNYEEYKHIFRDHIFFLIISTKPMLGPVLKFQ